MTGFFMIVPLNAARLNYTCHFILWIMSVI
jgi:hypothetical protein